MLTDLKSLLNRFPGKYFVYCFAYGSGVFQQAGRTDRAMVDLIFVVNDTRMFHRDNLSANPGDYSAVRWLGASAVSSIQTSFGANVYFNTLVTVGDLTFKYGVIDAADFCRDLQTWCTLYVAGRLHKPVVALHDAGGLSDLVARNLKSAVHAALLQLPDKCAEPDLYAAIAGLSYRGDFRMVIGEDKNKVANIVRPQIEQFRSLYASVFESMSDRLSVSATVEQDKSVDSNFYHLQMLPENVKNVLLGSHKGKRNSENVALQRLAQRDDVGRIVGNSICRIVFLSSLLQSIKGIPTAGLLKSVVYSYNKLNKMVKSMVL